MNPWSTTKVDFGSLHKFKTSLGVALLVIAVAGPPLLIGQMDLLPYIDRLGGSSSSEKLAWTRGVVVLSAVLLVFALVGAILAAVYGVKLIRSGLSKWQETQEVEDNYRRMFVDDFATKVATAPSANAEEVEQGIVDEVAHEDLDGEVATDPQVPPLPQAGLENRDRSQSRTDAPNRDRPRASAFEPTNSDQRSALDHNRRVIERINIEAEVAEKLAFVHRETHTARTNTKWPTATRTMIVDLALVPHPSSRWTPLIVEFKISSSSMLAGDVANRLATLVSKAPLGMYPARDGSPVGPVRSAGLIVWLARNQKEAEKVRNTIHRFNTQSMTKVGVFATTLEDFRRLSEAEIRAGIRSTLVDGDDVA